MGPPDLGFLNVRFWPFFAYFRAPITAATKTGRPIPLLYGLFTRALKLIWMDCNDSNKVGTMRNTIIFESCRLFVDLHFFMGVPSFANF